MTDSPNALDAERWRRLADIVEAMVELEPAYRSAYLTVLARQDAALQRDALRVLALFEPCADDRLRGTAKPIPKASTGLAGSRIEDHGWDAAEAERARRFLGGDVENIVAKALRIEPEHRYATVDRFAGDLRLFAEGRPVIATGDALSYRLSKFVQRHRVAVAAAIALAMLLIVFATASSVASMTLRKRPSGPGQRVVEAGSWPRPRL